MNKAAKELSAWVKATAPNVYARMEGLRLYDAALKEEREVSAKAQISVALCSAIEQTAAYFGHKRIMGNCVHESQRDEVYIAVFNAFGMDDKEALKLAAAMRNGGKG